MTKDKLDVRGEAGLKHEAQGLIDAAKYSDLVQPRISANEIGAGAWCVVLNVLAGLLILSVYFLLAGFDLNLASLMANVVGALILFTVGFVAVKRSWRSRFLAGMAMVVVGFIMLLATIALGG